ncbi:MAG: bL21 family ribosomal protein [Patescibacteria group bacterium]
MQAIIKIGSSQYIVEPGQELLVDRGQIDTVLYPDGAKVAIKDLGEIKGRKIRVAKYKAKSRYRKVRGFKPVYHKIKIEKITVDSREKRV